MDLGYSLHVVAVYDTDRQYGGPEEGGWWYTQGTLVGIDSGYKDPGEASNRCRDLNQKFREQTDDRDGWGTYGAANDRIEAHVVELGREELHPDLAWQSCHGDIDPGPGDYVIRWDVPETFPEGRPHYC